MTLYDVIRSLEQAQKAVAESLESVRSLVGSVAPIGERDLAVQEQTHKFLAAHIVKTAKKRTYKRRSQPKKRAGWTAKLRTKTPPAEQEVKPFRDYVIEALTEHKGPMHIDALSEAMSAKGWTTSSQNIRGLFGVMLPTVKGLRKVSTGTWELKPNGKTNGK
jgi:hypothetical protein